MRWLPYHRLVLESPLSVDEASRALRANLGEQRFFGFGDSTPLIGRLEGQRLSCHRRIRYRNSFLPVFVAKLEPTARGSRLVGVLRLFHMTAAFMVFWFGGVGAVLLVTLTGPLDPAAGDRPWLFPLGMLAAGVVLCVGAFAFEFQDTIDEVKLIVRGAEAGVDEFLG